MTLRRRWFAAALAAALALALGCGKKEEDAGGGSDGPSTGSGTSDIPAPPRSSGPLTAHWDRAEIAGARRETTNNLKQIGLAFFNFESATGHFPAGIYDKSGKKLGLSWRVAILPFIEGEGQLYKEFKLDEPWDSESNKKLIRKMPRVFAPPGSSISPGYTHYRGFSGEGALYFPPNAPGQPGMVARGPNIVAITDGTSNTILAAELAEPVIWTKPDELDYDAKKPLPKFGGIFEDGFYVLMCDGSVQFVKLPVPEPTLRAAITRAGGEPLFLSNPPTSRPTTAATSK